jgi:predicted amidohydrolase YtcJ
MGAAVAAPAPVADVVVTGARIFTAATPEFASALAIANGRILYVGDDAGARAYVGPRTRIRPARGRLIVPGLVDSHIHPIDIVDVDACDLKNSAIPLRRLSALVARCVARFRPAPGEWLTVYQWNPSEGNQPDAAYPSLRVALDRAAPRNPVELLGNEGHHGAYNSAALALAKDETGRVIGLSRSTLSGPFAPLALLVGTDESGEPNGAVNEEARLTMTTAHAIYIGLEAALRHPEHVAQRLNGAGITAVLDAEAAPEGLAVYDTLQSRGQLSFRIGVAQYYDPSRNRRPDGSVDYDGMVSRAIGIRARYAGNPLIRADFFKVFADGALEGDTRAVPPTLGEAALLEAYLQPIFTTDAAGHSSVTGYVDTAAPVCEQVRAHAEDYARKDAASKFIAEHGFHPGQCRISTGKLQDPREVELEYVKRMHLAGFHAHIHVIGDRALRTAIDAIELAREADGNHATRDSLAHIQLSRPEDIARAGRDRLYMAFTYGWAGAIVDDDMTVIPFLQRIQGNSFEARHAPGSWYDENAYPFRSSSDAGAILVAGSDAPVGTRDPQPFVNMAVAITRALPGEPPGNPRQTISIRDVLHAYTIDGARFLGRDAEFGSLEPGKSADFAVLDRDIVRLADEGHPDEIARARVRETWFQGRQVFPGRH